MDHSPARAIRERGMKGPFAREDAANWRIHVVGLFWDGRKKVRALSRNSERGVESVPGSGGNSRYARRSRLARRTSTTCTGFGYEREVREKGGYSHITRRVAGEVGTFRSGVSADTRRGLRKTLWKTFLKRKSW